MDFVGFQKTPYVALSTLRRLLSILRAQEPNTSSIYGEIKMELIDLRSDTVTKPSAKMLNAMILIGW